MNLRINVFHVIRRNIFKNPKDNPGINKRLNLLKQNRADIENVEINEQELDDMESGFHNSFVKIRDKSKINGIAEFKKIENKFFKKEANPNMVSWAEKEQMRYLNNSDSLVWTPEKLSESFPATPDTIKKIIKSQWKPNSQDRITRHDNVVSKNWKAFEKRKLRISNDLAAHIKKFNSREKLSKLNLPVPDKSIEIVDRPITTSTEFIDIIKSSKKNNETNNTTDESKNININIQPNYRSETYVLNIKSKIPVKHNYYTHQLFKKELTSNMTGDIPQDDNDKNYSIAECEPKVDAKLVNEVNSIHEFKNDQCSEERIRVVQKNVEKTILKINIPRNKKSKTKTYKVNDCFYDNNGEFLYKVPGMS